MGKRIYPLGHVRYWYCYTVEEICKLYDVHPQTVREWIKQGLKTTDKCKPALVYGNDIKIFLGKLNQSHKRHTAFNEMFCCKCREAKQPYQKRIYMEQKNSFVLVKARCKTCKTIMNKTYKMEAVPKLRSTFRAGSVLELSDSKISTVKTHIHDQDVKPQSEPTQMELFE